MSPWHYSKEGKNWKLLASSTNSAVAKHILFFHKRKQEAAGEIMG